VRTPKRTRTYPRILRRLPPFTVHLLNFPAHPSGNPSLCIVYSSFFCDLSLPTLAYTHPEVHLVGSFIALALVFFLLTQCMQVTRNLVLLGDWGGLFAPIAEQCIEILEYWWRDNGIVRWGMSTQQSPETA
jgi:hypothetical protein